VAALGAVSSGVVLEELHCLAAFRTRRFKNGIRLPVTGVLSRAFHDFISVFDSQDKQDEVADYSWSDRIEKTPPIPQLFKSLPSCLSLLENLTIEPII